MEQRSLRDGGKRLALVVGGLPLTTFFVKSRTPLGSGSPSAPLPWHTTSVCTPVLHDARSMVVVHR